VLATLSDFEPWLEDNKLVFFPEFTNHGPDHISSVISTAADLVTEPSWSLLTASDAAALILAALLHDCAMHISENGFITLVSHGDFDPFHKDDVPWPELWKSYTREALRFDGRKLFSLFGNTEPVTMPPLKSGSLTHRDRTLIDDFLHRHHARLAYEIATGGVPGPTTERLSLSRLDNDFRTLIGDIARSHGIAVREAITRLDKNSRRMMQGVHTTYVMALLRIADYLQIEAPRAPDPVLQTSSLTGPVSQLERHAHRTVVEVTTVDDDRESLYVTARPTTARDFVHISKLLGLLQAELDQTWAVLGEVYGPIDSLRDLGLTVRRIRSNIDDIASFETTVEYIPVAATFTTATADLLKLLIGPLYEHRSEIGIRELLQNAIDAILERRDVATQSGISTNDAVSTTPDILISITTDSNEKYLSVTDTGIGMTRDVLLNYFLRAGASFRYSEAWQKLHTDTTGQSRVMRSGRFGIGALAAYLLGDSMKVTTRAAHQASGITFDAYIEDENIELRKTTAPIGTTVRIRLQPDVAQRLTWHTELWDFYCGSDLIVDRTVDGRQVEQREVWPACGAKLPPTWRRLSHPGFADIQWSFWEPRSRTSIACNGIWVEEIHHDDDDYSYRSRHEKRKSKHKPNLRLSIFDRDGRLPLNLQRTSVTSIPFRDHLDEEIAKDFLAFAATRLPYFEDLNALFHETLRYPGLNQLEGDLYYPSFLRSPYGWILPSASSLTHLGANRLVFTMKKAKAPYSFPIRLASSHFICPFLDEEYGTNEIAQLLSTLVRYSAAKVIVPWKTMREMFREDKYSTIMHMAKVTPLGSRHSLLSFGSDFELSLDITPLQPKSRPDHPEYKEHYRQSHREEDDDSEYRDHDQHYIIAEVVYDKYFNDSEWGHHYSTASGVWSSLGIYSIPFAAKDRTSIIKHPQIKSYAQAHAKLWSTHKKYNQE
jgi:signal transduction histidine kinase